MRYCVIPRAAIGSLALVAAISSSLFAQSANVSEADRRPGSVDAAQSQDAILRELAALREEVRRLRGEIDALKEPARSEPAVAPLEMLQTQVAELAQVKVESSTRFPVRLFGAIHAGVFANSGNANWLDNPNLVAAPASPDAPAGTMSASLRQTRVGFAADGPTLGTVKTSAVMAMDFFGGIPGFQTGQVMALPRLLVAYGRFDGEKTAAEIGQDHVILAPRDPTSLAAFSFPLLFRSGNLYLRAPQARLERVFASRLHTAVGIVAPIGGDLVGDAYLFVPPALGGERSQRPAFQGRVGYAAGETGASRAIDAGVSGHVGWERKGADLARSWAGAVDFAARRDAVGVAGEAFVGDNIDAFGGALGLNARAAGGWGELQLFPSDRLSFAAGFGIDEIQNGSRFVLARQRNRSAYGNLIFSITPELQTSFEYRWLGTLGGGVERRNHHFDWVLARKF